MPKPRKRRGQHPQDQKLFGVEAIPSLVESVRDLSWLRSRGYAERSSMKIVGDRHQLTARQRTAVARCACADEAVKSRSFRRVALTEIGNETLLIDGFNLLTTIEAALGGGVLVRGRDGCIRDMASMHGNYRILTDTETAIQLALSALNQLSPTKVVWYLDKPVSNSGRLLSLIAEVAKGYSNFEIEVRLVKDPDPILKRATADFIVVTADSAILDNCARWVNLAAYVLTNFVSAAELNDLSGDSMETINS